MLDNFNEIRLRGKFIRLDDEDKTTNDSFVLSRWLYKFDVKQPTHLIIGLHQEDQRSIISPQYL